MGMSERVTAVGPERGLRQANPTTTRSWLWPGGHSSIPRFPAVINAVFPKPTTAARAFPYFPEGPFSRLDWVTCPLVHYLPGFAQEHA